MGSKIGQKLDKIGQANWRIRYMIKKLGTGVSKIRKCLLWTVPCQNSSYLGVEKCANNFL